MPLGTLLAASAFEVAPAQTSGFEGGRITNFREVEQGLADAAQKGNLEGGLPVTLRVDTHRRAPIRDAALLAAFGTKNDLGGWCRTGCV
jgi:hypothetical protein